MPESRWSPRFFEYCRAHGKTPEEMLAADDLRFPGGKMCGFMLWIGARWDEWQRRNPEVFIKTEEHHNDFDRMLAARPVTPCTDKCCQKG